MKYLIANWKMNDVDVSNWLEDFLSLSLMNKSLEIKVCANLYDVKDIVDASLPENTIFKEPFWMAQDVSKNKEGAYTGQISSKLLNKIDAGCLIGHSELREESDTNEIVHLKGIRLKEEKVSPVLLCVGESLNILEANKREDFIREQLDSYFKDGLFPDIIAYEPLWAIGTGVSADKRNIEDAMSIISKFLEENDHKNLPILYGGSVSSKNIEEILSITSVSGCLVGNSSLDGKEFARIVAKP